MKQTAMLAAEPEKLRSYREEIERKGQVPDWDIFRNTDRDAFQELRSALVKTQHGLCAYCEIDIHGMKPIQVEHYLPKSRGTPEAPAYARHLNYRNLLACCMGGVAPMHPHDMSALGANRTDYMALPFAQSKSCGDAKDDHEPADDLLDPRTLRLADKIFAIDPEGRIFPDEEGCRLASVPVQKVKRTIEILRLDCGRLTYARKKWWETRTIVLLPLLEKCLEEPQHLREILGPNQDGWLPRFFSTTRCYLGRLAEAWLAQQPQPSA